MSHFSVSEFFDDSEGADVHRVGCPHHLLSPPRGSQVPPRVGELEYHCTDDDFERYDRFGVGGIEIGDRLLLEKFVPFGPELVIHFVLLSPGIQLLLLSVSQIPKFPGFDLDRSFGDQALVLRVC